MTYVHTAAREIAAALSGFTVREPPSIPLVIGLVDMGAWVRAHDPVGMEQARRELPISNIATIATAPLI